MQPPKPIWGHLAAFFTIFVWGITFINTKLLLGSFTPVEIMFYRLVVALLVLIALRPPRLSWRNSAAHDSRSGGPTFLSLDWLRAEWRFMAAGLCGVTLYFLCQNIALSFTLAANVSVLVSVAPLFTALVSRFVLHEQLKRNFFIGFTVAIAGIILIAFNGSFVLKLNPLGDLLSVLAALVWAFYSVLIKQISARQSDLIAITRKVFTYGVLFTLLLLPLFDFHLGLERLVVPANLLNLIFLSAVASALCFITWNLAVHILGPVRTSVYIYIIPIITVIASLLVLEETVTLVAALGMALILAGMALSEQSRQGVF